MKATSAETPGFNKEQAFAKLRGNDFVFAIAIIFLRFPFSSLMTSFLSPHSFSLLFYLFVFIYFSPLSLGLSRYYFVCDTWRRLWLLFVSQRHLIDLEQNWTHLQLYTENISCCIIITSGSWIDFCNSAILQIQITEQFYFFRTILFRGKWSCQLFLTNLIHISKIVLMTI